jgi:hypothetical protein
MQMVTIYDMATGEMITAEGQPEVALPMAMKAGDTQQVWLAPRLEPVTAASTAPLAMRLPADLAGASISAFIAHQQEPLVER